MANQDWTLEEWETSLQQDQVSALYLYAPMCGTCQVASQMVGLVRQLLPDVPIGEADLNYLPELAEKYEIESVPCLLIQKDGVLEHKIYAFRNVAHLLEHFIDS